MTARHADSVAAEVVVTESGSAFGNPYVLITTHVGIAGCGSPGIPSRQPQRMPGAWTMADPTEQEPQHFAAHDALAGASAREWHKLQLAALAFVGLLGALTAPTAPALPMWLQSVAGVLALLALAVAAIGVLLAALLAGGGPSVRPETPMSSVPAGSGPV